MKNIELNTNIADQSTLISALSEQYSHSCSLKNKMETACLLENRANILRILAERLATQTREGHERTY